MIEAAGLRIACGALGVEAAVVLYDWVACWMVTRQGKPYSHIPLVAGLIGMAGALFAPWPLKVWLVAAAAAMDITIPMSIWCLLAAARRRRT
jgi:hypothetical protein